MTDELLLVFGCGVTFLSLAGAWIFLRGRALDVSVSSQDGRDLENPPTVATVVP